MQLETDLRLGFLMDSRTELRGSKAGVRLCGAPKEVRKHCPRAGPYTHSLRPTNW